jgi:hypothetical protein
LQILKINNQRQNSKEQFPTITLVKIKVVCTVGANILARAKIMARRRFFCRLALKNEKFQNFFE